MTLQEIKQEIQKYQYFEDTNIIDVSLASIIATRLKLGDPIWLIIIGASSGGKSQILRPLSLTDSKFMHRIDDMTENTFLSGSNMGKEKGEPSLLKRIGVLGMLVVSDFTVLFSKNTESRNAILAQFRMIYDGEMTKFSGTSDKPITWKGALGVLAGSTPSIYRHFEEVADMGERFIYYRMKDYSPEKATRLAMSRKIYGKELDEKLACLYGDYIKEIIINYSNNGNKEIELPQNVLDRILQISVFAENVRTIAHMDFYRVIDKIPVPAMPMRISLQLISIAKGLYVMRNGNLTEDDLNIIDWCGYSLANEEKRACLKVLGTLEFNTFMTTQNIADKIGLDTSVIRNLLQNLNAINVLDRTGGDEGLMWRIKSKNDYEIVRRIEKIKDTLTHQNRVITNEEQELSREVANASFDEIISLN